MKLFLEQELHNSYWLSGQVIIVEISEIAMDVYKFWKKKTADQGSSSSGTPGLA